MSLSNGEAHPQVDDDSGAPDARPRGDRGTPWRRLIAIITVVNVMTIGAAAWVSQEIFSEVDEVIAINQDMAGIEVVVGDLVAATRDLERSLGGNLTVEAIDGQRILRDDAVAAMRGQLAHLWSLIEPRLDVERRADGLGQRAAIERAAASLVASSEIVFQGLLGKDETAIIHGLTRIDEDYRDVLTASSAIEGDVAAIRHQLMTRQRATIDSIRELEFLILGGLVLIILATTLYGTKLVRDLGRSERQSAEHFDQLRRHDRELQRKIHDLSVARGALARGEQRFRDGIESMADGFILYDGEDRVVAWNSAYETMRPAQAPVPRVGQPFRDYCTEVARSLFNDEERIRSWVEWRVGQRKTARTCVELPRADGKFIEVNEHRTVEGGIVGLYRDVTEQRRAKQQLLATQARLQDFAAVASDWYWETGPDHRFTWVSDRIRVVGVDPESLIGQTRFGTMDADINAPELIETHRADHEARRPFRNFQYALRRGDGSIRHIAVNGRPLYGSDGGFIGYRGSATDITEQIAAEDALKQAKLTAENANRAKGEFLANMSHELRTPLNGVIALLDLLSDGKLPGEKRLQADMARGSANQLLEIIGNVLDISKLEAGAVRLESAPFDIDRLVDSAVQTFAPQAQGKGIEICASIADHALGWYTGDPTRLRQIVMNLIGNGVKFTERGSIVVLVDAEPEAGGKRRLRIAVRDTGIGIPEDAAAGLFGKFVQADASVTRRFGGTGLGLAICRELVTAMGGTIGFESKPGAGTSFTVDLALETTRAPKEEPDGAPSLQGLRALIVDDHDIVRGTIQRRLEGWGMAVEAVADANSAMAALKRASESGAMFDVMVIDRDMPGTSGLVLAQRVRAAGLARQPHLILCSPLAVASDVAGGAGAARLDAIVMKPIRAGQLRSAIVSLCRGFGRAASVAGPAPETEFRVDGARILLAEDNQTNSYAVTKMIERLGGEIIAARDGVEAVEAAARAAYDLILMDMQMPNMDGLEATRRIRAGQGPNRGTPILALTANAFTEDVERCLGAGMNAHLSKPLRQQTLIDAMRQHLPARAKTARSA